MGTSTPTLAQASDLATVASFADRLRSLVEDADAARLALSRLGEARMSDAEYALDCLVESASGRGMGGLLVLEEALRGVIDKPAYEPVAVGR